MMGTSSVEARTGKSRLISFLYVLSEFLVTFMLLVDSIFSFFITKFASVWKLQTPCLLCSRLDHVFAYEKRGYLWKLICCKHKLEISYLIFCHAHDKLVNVHEMCESCLLSFGTIKKSNSETYRLLVGKFGENPYPGIGKDPLHDEQKLDNTLSEKRSCSCCKEPYVPRGLIQTRLRELEIRDLDVPLSSSAVCCKEDFYESTTNPLPHVRFRELEIRTEKTANYKDDFNDDGVHIEPNFISPVSSLSSMTLAEPAAAPERLVLEPLVLLSDTASPVEFFETGHGLDELTPRQVDNGGFSSGAKLNSLDVQLPSSNSVDDNYVTTSNQEDKTECRETEKAEDLPTRASSDEQPVSVNVVRVAPNISELGEANKSTLGARVGRQLSRKLSEKWISKDSTKASCDDLKKLLLTQLSINRMNDYPRDMLSPRPSTYYDEAGNFDASNGAGGMQGKRYPLERNMSSLEYVDGSIVSEIEGESEVDHLKRQVEHDKMLMSSLYKELEEEINASAIAANQTMAMITRLQEEKASLQMEALQYIREMEEQREYDDDSLHKANDLINEKDKEIQDLEAELEYFRINFPNAYTIDNILKTSNKKERDIRVDYLESNHMGIFGYGNSDIQEKFGSEGSIYNNLLLEFEDDMLDIRQRLKKLENMLHLFSSGENGLDSENIKLENGENDIDSENRKLENGENDLDSENRKLESGEDHHADEDCLPSPPSPTSDKESSEPDCSNTNSVLGSGMVDFASLQREISKLNERMDAFEADKIFLEHTMNSLIKGEEGLQFVQEIAYHLRILRNVSLRS